MKLPETVWSTLYYSPLRQPWLAPCISLLLLELIKVKANFLPWFYRAIVATDFEVIVPVSGLN